MKAIPSDPQKRVRYFVTQVAMLKAKRAPDELVRACRAKLREAQSKLSENPS